MFKAECSIGEVRVVRTFPICVCLISNIYATGSYVCHPASTNTASTIHVNAHLSKNCKYWNVSAIVR